MLTQTSITSIVGTGIYSVPVPQEVTEPFITVQIISGDTIRNMGCVNDVATTFFQIDCWDTSSLGAETLATSVRNAVDGYSGTMGTRKVYSSILEDEREDTEENLDGTQTEAHRKTQTYRIRHQQERS